MTWVVAHANPIAVLMMSDIRISIGVGRRVVEVPHFGVKKIHHVAPTVYAGFAGSVVLGFRLISDLDDYLRGAYDSAISTMSLAESWAAKLPERIAPLVPPELAQEQTDVIVAGMHLALVTNADGTATDELMPFGTGRIVRLREPASGEADLEAFSWSSAGVSIGSGSAVPEYERFLREVDWIGFSNWDNPASIMTVIMNMTIESAPTLGISRDLIAMMMKHGRHGVVGSGLTRGPMASDRSLIAESEAQLHELWNRFAPDGNVQLARS